MHNDWSSIWWRTDLFASLTNKTKELRVIYIRLLAPPFQKLQMFHLSLLMTLQKGKRSHRNK